MKTTFSARFVQRMALTTALCAAALSAAHADDLNIKTMIPGVPQIDAESYILIDYNSGKVLAEQNADARRDPALDWDKGGYLCLNRLVGRGFKPQGIGGTGAVGGDARAAAYVELRVDDGRQVFGVGMDHDIISAAIRAVTSGVLRAARTQSAGAAQEAVA